ncbi:MAG: hypothetical protein M1828_001089 [Chrysothrix sp. TS-e1954]|nr:MAG: hypothetical protein M1828_001089 [Chrysothrix sp. TS-e1954]
MLRRPPTLLTLTLEDLADYARRRTARQSQASAELAAALRTTAYHPGTPVTGFPQTRSPSPHSYEQRAPRRAVGRFDGERNYERHVSGIQEEDAESLVPTEVDADEFPTMGMEIDMDAAIPSADASHDASFEDVDEDQPRDEAAMQDDTVFDPSIQPRRHSARLGGHPAVVVEEEEEEEGDTNEPEDDTPILTRAARRPGTTTQAPSRAAPQTRQQHPPPATRQRPAPSARTKQPPPRMGALARPASSISQTAEQARAHPRAQAQAQPRPELRTPSPRLPPEQTGSDEPAAQTQAPRREAPEPTRPIGQARTAQERHAVMMGRQDAARRARIMGPPEQVGSVANAPAQVQNQARRRAENVRRMR